MDLVVTSTTQDLETGLTRGAGCSGLWSVPSNNNQLEGSNWVGIVRGSSNRNLNSRFESFVHLTEVGKMEMKMSWKPSTPVQLGRGIIVLDVAQTSK